jgi:hypothetical protein
MPIMLLSVFSDLRLAVLTVYCGFLTIRTPKVGRTLVTLSRTVTPYRDFVDGTRGRVTCQKLVTR